MMNKKEIHRERLLEQVKFLQVNRNGIGRIGYLGHEFYVRIDQRVEPEKEVEAIIELYGRAVQLMVNAVRGKRASMFFFDVYPGSEAEKFTRYTATPIAAVFSEFYHMDDYVTGAIIDVKYIDEDGMFEVTTLTTKK